jgi:arylsulfatase A-like enzyme
MMKLNAIFLLLLVIACSPASPPEDRLNVLLVTLDTTRADRLGCYGYGKNTSPRMDALAEEGVRFDLAIAQAAVTPVSHASILTGLYPYQHGLRVLHGTDLYRLERGKFPTLPGLLKDHGFGTAAFVSAFPVSEFFGLDQGFDVFETGLSGDVDEKMHVNEDGKSVWAVSENQRRADVTTDEAIAWLEKNEKPFFLWLHYFDPHDGTLRPPKRFWQGWVKPSENRMQMARDLYDAEVAYMDLQLGRLFDFLKETGQYENTVICVTNDHGEGLGDHGWWAHRILYQEQIRMPLIVRIPGGPSRRVVKDLVRSIDIMPTLLDSVGVDPPPVEGKSLMGLIRGEKEPERLAYADALIRLDDNRPDHAKEVNNDLMYCVMNGKWKLIHRRFHPGASELYRIDEDPREQRNVIDEYPEVREKLFKYLEQPGIMIEELIPRAEDDEVTRRLKALGYIK